MNSHSFQHPDKIRQGRRRGGLFIDEGVVEGGWFAAGEGADGDALGEEFSHRHGEEADALAGGDHGEHGGDALGLLHDAGPEPLGGAERVKLTAEGRGGFAGNHDPAFVAESGEAERRGGDERVRGGEGDAEGFALPDEAREVAAQGMRVRAEEGPVDLPCRERLELRGGREVLQADLAVRVGLAEGLEQADEGFVEQRADKAEAQPRDLADLSQPMLDRARSRVEAAGARSVETRQGDLRALEFAEGTFDVILAGAVLHHLREDADWERVFGLLHRWLKPGGRLYVADLVYFDSPALQAMMWARYGAYLETLGGPAYREKVFAYIDREDSPRSLHYQLGLLQKAGFTSWDVLHRNSVFACYFGER